MHIERVDLLGADIAESKGRIVGATPCPLAKAAKGQVAGAGKIGDIFDFGVAQTDGVCEKSFSNVDKIRL